MPNTWLPKAKYKQFKSTLIFFFIWLFVPLLQNCKWKGQTNKQTKQTRQKVRTHKKNSLDFTAIWKFLNKESSKSFSIASITLSWMNSLRVWLPASNHRNANYWIQPIGSLVITSHREGKVYILTPYCYATNIFGCTLQYYKRGRIVEHCRSVQQIER